MTDLSTLAPTPGFYRFKVGSIEVVALHEGVLSFDRPPGLVRNASDEDVGEAYAVAGMPREKMTITFNALLVGAAKGWTLIDTGMGASAPPSAGLLAANMQVAGVRAEDVGAVVISHFHGDHIGGLRRADGGYSYPNAEICVPEKEWAFWMDDARMNCAPEALKNNFA
jgi:glyoxylase-like metal-dependent hydrolase (beta-lactamase superfamily II)